MMMPGVGVSSIFLLLIMATLGGSGTIQNLPFVECAVPTLLHTRPPLRASSEITLC